MSLAGTRMFQWWNVTQESGLETLSVIPEHKQSLRKRAENISCCQSVPGWRFPDNPQGRGKGDGPELLGARRFF